MKLSTVVKIAEPQAFGVVQRRGLFRRAEVEHEYRHRDPVVGSDAEHEDNAPKLRQIYRPFQGRGDT